MAARIHCVGDRAGASSTVKLVNQLLAGEHIAAAAEALALARRQGVDPKAPYEAALGAALGIHVKDLGLVLDAGRAAEIPLHVAAAAHQMFLHAAGAGLG